MAFQLSRKHTIPAGTTLGFPVSDPGPVTFRLIPGSGGSASLYTCVLSHDFDRDGTAIPSESILELSTAWPAGEVSEVTSDSNEGPIAGYIVQAIGADAIVEVLQ